MLRKGISYSHRMFSSAADALAKRNKEAADQLRKEYPWVPIYGMPNSTIYTLRGESPEEVSKTGGFVSQKKLWISSNGNGMNEGSICFSLLPEAAGIFLPNVCSKKAYLYAIPAKGYLFLPGGPYCQVISPGAFPLSGAWVARQILGIAEYSRHIMFGPVIRAGEMKMDNRLEKFLKGTLQQPADISLGEHPAEFYLPHTRTSKKLQDGIDAYYLNHLHRASLTRSR